MDGFPPGPIHFPVTAIRIMRILLIGMGGVNAAFRNWTEPSLAHALRERGHEVYSYSYFDPSSSLQGVRDEIVFGVQVHRVKLGPVGFSRELWSAMLHDRRPDIVHIHHLRNELAWQALSYFKRRRVPVVLSPIGLLHDRFISDNRDDPLSHPIKQDNLIFNLAGFSSHLTREFSPRKHLRNWLTHYPLRGADHLVALSDFEKGLFVRLGIDADRITVIPFAVDLRLIDAALETVQAPRDFGYSRPILLFIGQLKYRKGFDLLLRAAPKVRAEFPTASFVFLTHNLSQRKAFMDIAAQVGASEYIYLVKQQAVADTEIEKMRQYRWSDVFVFPTRYEGFGIPLLEAMACRAPVVTTNIPVIDEIVQDGETGILAQLNDADDLAEKIICVLRNRSLRDRITQQGRKRVESFYTEEIIGERTERLYRDILSRYKSGVAH